MGTCRGKVVRAQIKRQAPRTNRHLRLTTILRSRDTRALVMVRRGSYHAVARLARQGGTWRVQGLRRI